ITTVDGGYTDEVTVNVTTTGKPTFVPPSISIENATAAEGENIDFSIRLDTESDETITVAFDFLNETTDNEDYNTNIEPVTFAPGQISQIVSVPTREDDVVEENETFVISISEVISGEISDFSDVAVGTIVDRTSLSFFEISPNPARTNSYINLDGMQSGLYEIALFSMSGELVQKENITVDSTAYELLLNSLSRGLYVLRVTGAGGQSFVEKIIIQ
ncbi:MAG: T9SS type A sorting domain-containing protein, partial [Bacteroidota bacterium]